VSARRWMSLFLALLVALPMAGCANEPEPKDSAAALRSTRAQVVAAVKKVGAQLAADGATFGQATGRFSVCGSAPTTSMEYGGGGKLSGDTRPIAERIDAAASTLQADGWKVVASSKTSSAAKRPYTNLEKDGLHLSLNPDVLRGSDALTFSIVGDCLRVTKEQVGEFGKTDTIVA
jgi:hypothetical protein